MNTPNQLAAQERKATTTALFLAYHRYLHAIGYGIVAVDPAVVQEDRAAHQAILFDAAGAPAWSEDNCAGFMHAVTGLPLPFCYPWARSLHAVAGSRRQPRASATFNPFVNGRPGQLANMIASLMPSTSDQHATA